MDHDMLMPGHGGGHQHGDEMMKCSMSMVWNTSTQGVCIVFSSWRISGPQSLFASLFVLFLLSVLLEYIRLCIRSLDAHLIASHNLTSSIFSAMSGNASHRRKASIQQSRHASNSLGGSAALLSSGIHPTMGDRRLGPGGATTNTTTNSSDSTTSTGIWGGAASGDDAPLLPGGSISRKPINRSPLSTLQTRLVPSLPIARAQQLRRSTLYVASVALSMFLMLVFMTYNAWLIGAVLLGAACGHYLFSRDMGLGRLGEEKGMACH